MPFYNKRFLFAIVCVVCGCSKTLHITVTPTATPPRATETVARPSPTPTRAVTPSIPPTSEPLELNIPGGIPPTIDGRLDEGEWAAALVAETEDGSEIYFMQADGILYIGIRGSTPEMIVGNIFMAAGDTIRILHASAALGTAVYKRGEKGWMQLHNFEWCCRATSQSEVAQAEREAFLNDEGWVSTNSRIGTPNELEFHIVLPEAQLQLAINILRGSNPDVKIPFPMDLVDDVITPTPGGYPDVMHFTPEAWAKVRLEF